LAVLSEPYEDEQTTIFTNIDNETFIAKEKDVKKQGWKEINNNRFEDDTKANDQQLPIVKKGDQFSQVELQLTNDEIKPLERITEGALLQAMENPARYMESNEKHLAGTLHKSGGLGTVATRADIIEKLFNIGYMEMKGKHIFITSKGKQLLEVVPQDLNSHDYTWHV